MLHLAWFYQAGLFLICLIVLLLTVAPTLYMFDSAEFAIGVATLGIVHAPGYPLYLLSAHVFTWLPLGDIAYRVNVFSTICLALTVPILYGLISELLQDRLVALAASLVFIWSFYVWNTGLAAEVYAPQIFTIALCGRMLVILYCRGYRSWKIISLTGLLVGIAVAMAPSTILLVPGVVIAFGLLRIEWRKCLVAAGISVAVFGATLLYFPVRYAADPALNLAGQYDEQGRFQKVDLRTAQGIWWVLRGEQFERLFFTNGYIPTPVQTGQTISWFWANFLGIGFLIGVIGIPLLFQTNRGLLLVWAAAFLPYTYFYATYGAVDRDMMFGPSYLLWSIPLAYGLKWIVQPASRLVRPLLLLSLPAIMLIVNFPLANQSRNTGIRDHAQTLMNSITDHAVVIGTWWDIVPLQYLQMVEGQRQDLTLYNTFLFRDQDPTTYIDRHLNSSEQPVIVLGSVLQSLDLGHYRYIPLYSSDSSTLLGVFRLKKVGIVL